uniref:Uncharacterized protein n=1 Tax=Monodelphis domestica TaxID=13616 RepID=A0A5F8GZ83_MONDO
PRRLWRRRRGSRARGGARPRPPVVPIQGAERGPGGRQRALVLPQPGARFPLPAAPVQGVPLGGAHAGGQRAPQQQRPAAVAPAARRAGPRAARLRAQLLLGRQLHPLPVRPRAARRLLPRLPGPRRARQRALPPVPAAAAAPASAGASAARCPSRTHATATAAAACRMCGVRCRAGRHEGHRHRHDGRRGLHLRHARDHLSLGGLHHREPHAPRLRASQGPQAALKAQPPVTALGVALSNYMAVASVTTGWA